MLKRYSTIFWASTNQNHITSREWMKFSHCITYSQNDMNLWRFDGDMSTIVKRKLQNVLMTSLLAKKSSVFNQFCHICVFSSLILIFMNLEILMQTSSIVLFPLLLDTTHFYCPAVAYFILTVPCVYLIFINWRILICFMLNFTTRKWFNSETMGNYSEATRAFNSVLCSFEQFGQIWWHEIVFFPVGYDMV